jgi:hypothetical protein
MKLSRRILTARRIGPVTGALLGFGAAAALAGGVGAAYAANGSVPSVYEAANDNVLFIHGNVATTIVTLNLPAGVYAVTGRVEVSNNGGGTALVNCGITSGDFNVLSLGSVPEVFVLQDELTLPTAGHVVMKCKAADGAAGRGRISAISVASWH